jgi:glucose-1-phosphate cytidylyltransferase
MQVVILCGGLGTRLREETEYRPKPMVTIGGRPILWHIMKCYAHHGFRRFILCLGYRGEMIKEYFLSYEAMNNDFTVQLGKQNSIRFHNEHTEQDFEVTLVDTGQPTMTGGRLKRVAPYLDGDTFMMTYGDGLADVDLTALAQFHQGHGKLATVTAVRPISRYGVLDLAKDAAVKRFIEKPRLDGWISAGFFVMHRDVLATLAGDACVFEQQPLYDLAARGELRAFKHEGFFYAMDTHREREYLETLWREGSPPWRVWEP